MLLVFHDIYYDDNDKVNLPTNIRRFPLLYGLIARACVCEYVCLDTLVWIIIIIIIFIIIIIRKLHGGGNGGSSL